MPLEKLPNKPLYDKWYEFDRGIRIHKKNFRKKIRTRQYTAIIETNSEGFRSSEEFQEGGVAVLGDSFVEAQELNEQDTFVKLLETRLGGHWKNYGVGRNNLGDYLTMYKRYIRHKKPDELILTLWLKKDFKIGKLKKPTFIRRLANYSLIYRFLRFRNRLPDLGFWERPMSKEYQKQMDKARYALIFLLQAILKDGVKVRIVVFPSIEEINYDMWYKIPNYQEYDKMTLRKAVKNICDSMGVQYIDPISDMTRDMFFKDNWHLNKKGHQFLANYIYDELYGK